MTSIRRALLVRLLLGLVTVAAALRGDPGPHTPFLAFTNAYAAADWESVTALGRQLGVLDQSPDLSIEAGDWARSVLAPRI